jgi:hypothetical protein
LVDIVPAVAVKVVDTDPAGTVTEFAGTGSNELLLDKETALPPAGAGALRLTVQTVAAPEFKLVGLQASDDKDTVTGEVKLMLAVRETPLKEAVNVAL